MVAFSNCSIAFAIFVTLLEPVSLAAQDSADDAIQTVASSDESPLARLMLDQAKSGIQWVQDRFEALRVSTAEHGQLAKWQEKLRAWTGLTREAVPAVDTVAAVIDAKNLEMPRNVIYVRFSKQFLAEYLSKEFEKTVPVRDTVLGAAVSGTSHTKASTEFDLVENSARAQAKLYFKGKTTMKTTSRSGPVQIHGRGTTRFTAEKTIWFDGLDMRQSAAETVAETHNETTGITTSLPGVRGRVSLRTASQREAENHRQAERITAERTKRRIERAFERVLNERMAAFMQELRTQYANLALDGRFVISEVRCSTTPETLEVAVLGRGDKATALAEAPPTLRNGPDIEVHVHTGLVKKVILDPHLRGKLRIAVRALVERPRTTMISPALKPRNPQPERELKIHWEEGQGQWFSLAWHADESSASGSNSREKIASQKNDVKTPR